MTDAHRFGGRLEVDPSASIHETAAIDHSADVTIGANAMICEGALIYTHAHSMTPGKRSKRRHITTTPLQICPGAFIGARAIVLPGCTRIGTDAIVGAGAVITKDVPDRETWAGNPARMVARQGARRLS